MLVIFCVKPALLVVFNDIKVTILFSGTLIHASLRLRNIKNKISGKIEFVGIKRTPMGLLLESLGNEQEVVS